MTVSEGHTEFRFWAPPLTDLGSPVETVDLSKNFSWISPHTARTDKKAINKIQEATMARC
jgi:hypothetical protein